MSLPIRARLTAWYLLLLTAILAALGTFLLLRLRTSLIAGIDDSLDVRAAQISLGAEAGGEGEFQDVSDASLTGLPRGEYAAQLLSSAGVVEQSAGDVVAEAPMLPLPALQAILAGRTTRRTVSLGPDGEPFRILGVAASIADQGPKVLVVAASLEETGHSVHQLFVLLLVAGPLALAGAGIVGWWVVRRALSPVARMTEQADRIGVDDLHERIAAPAVHDELGRLAGTLNAMLDRVERGVAERRRFIADASHELRTPLAIMRSELDVSLRSDQLPPAARTVLDSAAEEVERMSQIVENLLTLARIDEGKLELLREPVDLAEVMADVGRDVGRLADRNGVRLAIDAQPTPVVGDRQRLRQAVVNLVENAVKYTGPGGEVRAETVVRAGEACVVVSDTGPGIPPDILPRIFDRFVRADEARSRSEGGSGLGLAISSEIAAAHGGRITVQSERGVGSSFTLVLPASADRPAGRVTLER